MPNGSSWKEWWLQSIDFTNPLLSAVYSVSLSLCPQWCSTDTERFPLPTSFLPIMISLWIRYVVCHCSVTRSMFFQQIQKWIPPTTVMWFSCVPLMSAFVYLSSFTLVASCIRSRRLPIWIDVWNASYNAPHRRVLSVA